MGPRPLSIFDTQRTASSAPVNGTPTSSSARKRTAQSAQSASAEPPDGGDQNENAIPAKRARVSEDSPVPATDAFFGEVVPFGIEPVYISTRYKIRNSGTEEVPRFCYDYAVSAGSMDKPLKKVAEYRLLDRTWTTTEAHEATPSRFTKLVAADEYTSRMKYLRYTSTQLSETNRRRGYIVAVPPEFKLEVRALWQRTGHAPGAPAIALGPSTFDRFLPEFAPFIRVVVRAEPCQPLTLDEHGKYHYKWCIYLRASVANAAIRDHNIPATTLLRQLLSLLFSPSSPPVPSDASVEEDRVAIPVVTITDLDAASIPADLSKFDLFPDQVAMVAAMLAKEQAAFELIKVQVRDTRPPSPFHRFGAGGVHWSPMTLRFGETQALVDYRPVSRQGLAICPLFVDISSAESNAIGTALALVAAGNRAPRPMLPSSDFGHSALACRWLQPQDP
ncbi:hypothetical protein BC828DRAFT_92365 [Blastocladiella britannica]|nr:hypothetical protein BC828DRAFT_92365 [Blastocladiella britannica]